MKSLVAPVIVIGAARSGTKLLRGLIGAHPDFEAVPYDVNYIWRMGNESVSHDELEPSHASARVIARVRRELAYFAKPRRTLVEKTVSNTLRVGFVDRILPDARFIHLLRDGRDVIASAYDEWRAPVDWRYLAEKARGYPVLSAPGYAFRWAASHLLRRRSRLPPIWGPAYRGIHEDLSKLPLLQVCAVQWQQSVESALDQLDAIPSDRVLTVHYGDLVSNPDRELPRIYHFLGVDPERQPHGEIKVSIEFVGSHRTTLTTQELADVERWVEPTLQRVAHELGT